MFQLKIHGICSKVIVVDMGTNEKEFKNMLVSNLKKKLVKETHLNTLDVEHFRFLFRGKQMEDDKTLGFYDIENQSLIMAVVRVIGGKDT
jgi:hypothetical protein